MITVQYYLCVCGLNEVFEGVRFAFHQHLYTIVHFPLYSSGLVALVCNTSFFTIRAPTPPPPLRKGGYKLDPAYRSKIMELIDLFFLPTPLVVSLKILLAPLTKTKGRIALYVSIC